MTKPFAAFDIDGTVVRWQLYHAMTDNLLRQGFIKQNEFEAVRVARMNWKRRGGEDSFRDYEAALVKIFEKVLKGLPSFALEAAAQTVFSEYADQVYTYTRDLIKTLREQDYLLFAISGSPEIIIKKFATHYGFDDFAATHFPLKNGYFTGERELTVGKKADLLQALVTKHGLSFEGSLAIGDSEGDAEMMGLVEHPIAFNPSQSLLATAKANHWEVVVERKNVIYKLGVNSNGYVLQEE